MSDSKDNRIDTVQELDAVEDEMGALEQQLQGMEDRLDRMEDQVQTTDREIDAEGDDVRRLRLSVLDLKREHRAMTGLLEDDIFPYLRETTEILRTLKDKIQYYGEIMRHVKVNERKILAAQADVSGKVGRTEFDNEIKELQESVKKLSARMDYLADAIDE